MKRWFIFALCVVFVLGIVGCDALVSDNIEESTVQKQEQIENIQICIRVGETTLYADMYDSELAKEFVSLLPQTISMQRVGGGREFYGSLDGRLNYDKADSQTTFENGEIAYWYSGNGVCLLYNNQVEEPEITSGIIVLGKITSDFSILSDLEDQIEVNVELKNKD